MRVTTKGRYALSSLLDLVSHYKGNPIRTIDVSIRQNIELNYLEQIFRKLRIGNILFSVKGPGGGYTLACSMDEITVKDILNCVGENINPALNMIETNNTAEFNLSKNYLEELGRSMREHLEKTTLGDLIRRRIE